MQRLLEDYWKQIPLTLWLFKKKILQRHAKVFFPQHLLDLSLNDATHRRESKLILGSSECAICEEILF